MLLYGELSFEEEGEVEEHLESCANCRAALEREKQLHAAFDRIEIEPSSSLLRECRAALAENIHLQAGSPIPREGLWDKFVSFLTGPSTWAWRPAGALALLAIGFAGAKLTPFLSNSSPAVSMMGLADATSAKVRNVETAPNGKVIIVLDETSQKTVSGNLTDSNIRAMLMAAARQSDDPGVRAQTVQFLTTAEAGSPSSSLDVRDVLISALHDKNAGVRLKAMNGLKTFEKDPAVRSALASVLLTDENPGVRTQAIDLLTDSIGPTVDPEIVGKLQELMVKESNPYVRDRCQSVLASWNASSEIY
jgi:hypothetical protein